MDMHLFSFGLALAFYYTIHSVLANNQVKAMLKNYLIPAKYYRLVYNLVSIVLLLPITWIYWVCEKQALFPNTFFNQIPGVVLFVLGLVLTQKALRQYDMAEFSGLDQYAADASSKPQQLNTTGLNGIIRHPLYLAALLVCWGLFLVLPNTALLTLAIITSLYLIIGIHLEEKKLLATFGQAYQTYRQQVPMLFPKFPQKVS